ncbi:hypothetical protein NRB20_75380 [Nocardia sp. RB20]|uniref:Uncharacterized protein n=1 Tax=Nocardia macrotermitis TaxID=2585198 RepID=A0A7K0DF27_9NOCA|nr:hypothetical protein [Nocardia macrotermitis]
MDLPLRAAALDDTVHDAVVVVCEGDRPVVGDCFLDGVGGGGFEFFFAGVLDDVVFAFDRVVVEVLDVDGGSDVVLVVEFVLDVGECAGHPGGGVQVAAADDLPESEVEGFGGVVGLDFHSGQDVEVLADVLEAVLADVGGGFAAFEHEFVGGLVREEPDAGCGSVLPGGDDVVQAAGHAPAGQGRVGVHLDVGVVTGQRRAGDLVEFLERGVGQFRAPHAGGAFGAVEVAVGELMEFLRGQHAVGDLCDVFGAFGGFGLGSAPGQDRFLAVVHGGVEFVAGVDALGERVEPAVQAVFLGGFVQAGFHLVECGAFVVEPPVQGVDVLLRSLGAQGVEHGLGFA